MSEKSRRNRTIAIIIAIILLLLLIPLRCLRFKSPEPKPATVAVPAAQPATPVPGTPPPAEVLTPATLEIPARVNAGASFPVKWTGPNNAKDYITIVRKDVAAGVYANYEDTKRGNPLQLLAPMETGEWEVRYMTTGSKTILGRAPIVVFSNEVTLSAPPEVVAGTVVTATWTGPNNAGDYLTLVPKATPDGQYGNYTYTTKGSPLTVTAPIAEGDAELRYMTGQGAKVLHRIPVRVVMADIELDAPAMASAGSKVTVKWTGPNNAGDYLTLVPQSLPDGQYASYANTNQGATLTLVALKSAGLAEIRYMSGQGAKVLKRHTIVITP